MSLTGDPDGPPYRAGISVFDVMAGPARHDRDPGRPEPPDRDGRGAAPRGSLLASAMSGMVNQTSAYAAGGWSRSGWATPTQPVPLRAAALLRGRRAGRHRGQRRPVPQAVRGPRRAGTGRRPAVRHQPRPHGQPGEAAAAAGRAAGGADGKRSGSASSSRPACRAGRSTRWTRAWPSPPRSAWSRWSPPGDGEAARPVDPPPGHVLRHSGPYPLPPPAWTSTATRSAAGSPACRHRMTQELDLGLRTTERDAQVYPTSIGTSDPTTITLLGQDLAGT
jgi:hypothetical protein